MSDERRNMSDTEIFDTLCGDCMGITDVPDEEIRDQIAEANQAGIDSNDPDFCEWDQEDFEAALRGRDSYFRR